MTLLILTISRSAELISLSSDIIEEMIKIPLTFNKWVDWWISQSRFWCCFEGAVTSNRVINSLRHFKLKMFHGISWSPNIWAVNRNPLTCSLYFCLIHICNYNFSMVKQIFFVAVFSEKKGYVLKFHYFKLDDVSFSTLEQEFTGVT